MSDRYMLGVSSSGIEDGNWWASPLFGRILRA